MVSNPSSVNVYGPLLVGSRLTERRPKARSAGTSPSNNVEGINDIEAGNLPEKRRSSNGINSSTLSKAPSAEKSKYTQFTFCDVKSVGSRKRIAILKKLFVLAAVAYGGRKLTMTPKSSESLKSPEPALQEKGLLNSAELNTRSLTSIDAKTASEQDAEAEDAFSLFKLGSESTRTCGTDVADVDFTLSFQLTSDRMWHLKDACKKWGNHPISAAIGSHLSRGDIMHALKGMGCNKNQLNLQVVDTTKFDSYPVNHMRNLALSGVKTSHTLLLDADFRMSDGLYENLMSHKEAFAANSKLAVVVPAFELRRQCDLKDPACQNKQKKLMPNTKEELMKLLPKGVPALEIPRNATVAPFDLKGNVHGHGSTLYDHWLADDSGCLKNIECVTSPRYEPYLAFEYCKDFPSPQAAFKGYGKNKFVWIQQMLRSGYKLMQLNDSFVIHYPHKPSAARKTWDKAKKHERELKSSKEVDTKKKLDNLEEQFTQWMEKNIPDNTLVLYPLNNSAIASLKAFKHPSKWFRHCFVVIVYEG